MVFAAAAAASSAAVAATHAAPVASAEPGGVSLPAAARRQVLQYSVVRIARVVFKIVTSLSTIDVFVCMICRDWLAVLFK